MLINWLTFKFTSKIQIRKTSLVLLGHRYNDVKKKRSISESYAQHPLMEDELGSISLHAEIRQLKETIQNRDEEIGRLRREIHKLKVALCLFRLLSCSLPLCKFSFFFDIIVCLRCLFALLDSLSLSDFGMFFRYAHTLKAIFVRVYFHISKSFFFSFRFCV